MRANAPAAPRRREPRPPSERQRRAVAGALVTPARRLHAQPAKHACVPSPPPKRKRAAAANGGADCGNQDVAEEAADVVHRFRVNWVRPWPAPTRRRAETDAMLASSYLSHGSAAPADSTPSHFSGGRNWKPGIAAAVMEETPHSTATYRYFWSRSSERLATSSASIAARAARLGV